MASGSFAPLKNRDFALFFWASAISNAGSSMQQITVPFVVYELTGSRTWLGTAALLGQLPAVAANFVSGTLADRLSVKKLLIATQAAMMVFACGFWFLWASGLHHLPVFLTVVVLNGLFQGVVFPVWQSFVASLVPREELTPAIRMNSLQFSLARVLGPLAGGITLERWGPSVSFASNAITYLLVLGALLAMKTRPNVARAGAGSGWQQIKEGWRYTLSSSSLTLACATTAMAALCGWSLMSLSPALAREHFHTAASKTGWINAANGIGASTAALVFAVNAHRFRRSTTAKLAVLAWVVGIALMGAAPTLGLGLVGFFIMGFGHTTSVTSLQPAIQHQVDDRYRGRVLGVYMQGVLMGPSIGAFVVGWAADFTGLTAMVFVVAALFTAYFAFAMTRWDAFRALDAEEPVPWRGRSLYVPPDAAGAPAGEPARTR